MRGMVRLILAIAFGVIASTAAAEGSRVPRPHFTVDKSTQCVAPPEVMRRTHMNMLMHRRDQTVHLGIRGGDEALNRCIACHASKTTGAAIGAPDAFCQSCHDYAGVKLDCFDCHQGRPGIAAKVSARQP
ncbi:MAG: Hdr-like menaquinol oxidoreductase cytochrome c subunit [Gemmatimonadota bacterium]